MLKRLFAKFKREANPVLDAYRVKYMKKRFEELNQIGGIGVIWDSNEDNHRFQEGALIFPGGIGVSHIRADFGVDTEWPEIKIIPEV